MILFFLFVSPAWLDNLESDNILIPQNIKELTFYMWVTNGSQYYDIIEGASCYIILNRLS